MDAHTCGLERAYPFLFGTVVVYRVGNVVSGCVYRRHCRRHCW